jgi:uncharacterized protein (TIGR03435 family)
MAIIEPAGQSVALAQRQTAAEDRMAFDVASVRQSKPGAFTPPSFPLDAGDAYAATGGRFSADFSLATYIAFAYKLSLTQEQRQSMLARLPKWVATDRFDIQARAEGNPTKDQMRLMMQSLLADRFKLALHFETREVPVLALTLVKSGKTGPKLRPHSEGPACDAPVPLPEPRSSAGAIDVFPSRCDVYMLESKPNHMNQAGSRNTTMDLLAASLPSLAALGRPVVDQTGLTGMFDFTIEWTPESNSPQLPNADGQTDSQGPTFLEAVHEQLGLKLEATKAPIRTLVIDHVERPSEN